MMESSDSKKSIFYMIVLILTLITMIIGATLAYFSLVASQKEEGTKLYTGKLEINYIDGVYIQHPELIPQEDPGFDTYDGVYRNTFAVSSAGTLEQAITLELEVTKNEFREHSLRYTLFNENEKKIATGYVPQTGKVSLADNLYLEPTGTAQYTLLIWWINTNYNQNADMGKSIVGKINVHAKQIRY